MIGNIPCTYYRRGKVSPNVPWSHDNRGNEQDRTHIYDLLVLQQICNLSLSVHDHQVKFSEDGWHQETARGAGQLMPQEGPLYSIAFVLPARKRRHGIQWPRTSPLVEQASGEDLNTILGERFTASRRRQTLSLFIIVQELGIERCCDDSLRVSVATYS